ncbi:hypothetical protein K7X08_033695 [Anisodus acutangulus]|uniref:TF-B3 domain-containing protein n=1 Tax=Anisodus acutangulus TaxID=402998 RepID=A0A9Q1M2J5_9SOLA|nr:hypothetical protein K7X08_033695 [Anisodus acutangulus]
MASKVRRKGGEGFSHRKSSTNNNNILQPKFYKIIFPQHECTRLRIPEEFASRYCRNMLNPVYLEVPSGEVWEVEVEHSQGQIWLAEGWQDFTDYYSIRCGHFLMFGYNAHSHFNVTIFDLSAAEIEYPYSSRTFYCHETHHAPERDQSESDDSVDILEDIPRRQKAKEKSPDMVEHSVEYLDHVRLGQSSKRKRQEGVVEDDVSVDTHIKRMGVEKSQEDVASPSFKREGQKSNEDCRKHKQQSKSVYDQNKTVTDKESSIAYQKAKAFKFKNPFIISFMQPSYVFTTFNLYITSTFARKYFLENDGNLVLRVPGRGSWSVKCTIGPGDAKVHSGWKAFVLENKLKVGDVCVFEVVKGTQLFIDVTIFRADGRTPMHKIAQEEPGLSDSKTLNIKTDNPLPCSQPKVVHTEKLKQRRGGSYGFSPNIKEEHDEGTEIEHSVEILNHCLLGHGSKRKRPEEEVEDDVSIDIHTKSIKVENSQEDVASPSFTRKIKKSSEDCRKHTQQSKSVYDQSKTVMDKESSIAYQKAKAFKSNNPFIISFMRPSYVFPPVNLTIALEFARKYFLENDGNLVLRVPGRGSWPVKYSLRTAQAKLSAGWPAFVQDNKLKIGDVCVFEFIKGTQPFLDVTIFRAAERKPMHKIDGGVSDCKNKIIKTENSVPCSQPKIVYNRKLNLEKKQKGDSDGFITSKIKEELSEGTGKHVQQSKSSCMGRVVAKEMVMAYQKAKAFTSENPFFISFMQPSYVSLAGSQMQLSMALPVARKFFATKHSVVVLQVSSKRSWAVKCILGTANAKFTAGWKEFVLDNNLKVGSVCVFERVSRSKLLFNVIIFPSAEGM